MSSQQLKEPQVASRLTDSNDNETLLASPSKEFRGKVAKSQKKERKRKSPVAHDGRWMMMDGAGKGYTHFLARGIKKVVAAKETKN